MVWKVRDLKRRMARSKAVQRNRGPGVRLSPAGRRYDWRPDKPDYRDVMYKLRRAPLKAPPPRVDLRPKMPPVLDQGSIGSCTANALAACVDYHQLKEDAEPGQGQHEYVDSQFSPTSRLFIYWHERQFMGTPMEDSGGFIRDGIKALWQVGACRESLWPYDQRLLFQRPVQPAFDEAARFKVTEYMRCCGLEEIKQALSDNLPVAFGFMVYAGFESAQVAQGGRMWLPRPGENDLGGHAVCAVGYDDPSRVLIIRNSWGTGWGDQGYFYMPYEYVEQGLADDFWVVKA